ncbi:hypothetical protein AVEN_181946-1 [Araneus ventricosus]|uniref:Uncharacterized protein n=1 Tax=Araneus ventricosus TaxID=182803 RepID=A0A4Y2UPD8_ARAVE|nr:hypothetical protein AVEN_181946-1 [Araneus ventricosus]
MVMLYCGQVIHSTRRRLSDHCTVYQGEGGPEGEIRKRRVLDLFLFVNPHGDEFANGEAKAATEITSISPELPQSHSRLKAKLIVLTVQEKQDRWDFSQTSGSGLP